MELQKTNQRFGACTWIALGSNLGDRAQHLADAITRLRAVITIDQISSLYETEPAGYLDQPHFLNMVCGGQTKLTPPELLAYAKATETQLGRLPTFRNGPRIIDIDILLYGAITIQQKELIIPHPRMHERVFVLVPLAEIAPNIVHPLFGSTISELKEQVPSTGIRKIELSFREP
ncbi:MAG: 2-amino-4-hydroxy-6-hydroxymethyldihydropteridine diphosphokinase [Ktedonobacteraceae bacterium]|nr:2-amino-4-hydroxy-6-hydroxymethyldihydropteridine diphosphokinase [Ktedonobacteraceae bacterium]